MHIRLEQSPKDIKIKLPDDEEVKTKFHSQNNKAI